MQNRHTNRKPVPLLVMILLTGLCVFSITTASADESIFDNVKLFQNVYLEQLRDGDVIMSGGERAGLYLSAKSQTGNARYVSQHNGSAFRDSGVHMSWKISW